MATVTPARRTPSISLQGEMVYPVADTLRARGIPCVLAIGHDAEALPDAYIDVPRLETPMGPREVVGALVG